MRVPYMWDMFDAVNVLIVILKNVVNYGRIKASRCVSSSIGYRRTFQHVPQPDNSAKKRVSQGWIMVTGRPAF